MFFFLGRRGRGEGGGCNWAKYRGSAPVDPFELSYFKDLRRGSWHTRREPMGAGGLVQAGHIVDHTQNPSDQGIIYFIGDSLHHWPLIHTAHHILLVSLSKERLVSYHTIFLYTFLVLFYIFVFVLIFIPEPDSFPNPFCMRTNFSKIKLEKYKLATINW